MGLFSSCNEPVREYLEYWSSTCQVGKIEYISDNTELDETPNLSALSPVEINIYLINPKGYEILTKPGGAPCFHFKDQNGSSTFYSEYSETAMDRNTTIKIRATLPDDTEGQTITLTGCIWPENRSSLGFDENQLLESFPELFYTTTFVQNTPPDNVKNMNSSGEGDFYSGTNKHYLSFTLPNLGLKKNHGARYEIKTYLRETDGELYYKGSQIVGVDDSDLGNHTYLYYFDEQEDYLFYEYTVQVLGPHGLTSELLATDERLGVHQLTEPTITISGFNGLEDEEHYKCIEVESEADSIPFTTAAADPNDRLTVKVDGTDITGGTYAVSGIGQHIIEVTSSKDGSRPISVNKKIRIVKTPDPATFTFASDDTTDLNGFNGFTDTNGFEYLEVPAADSTVRYSISPTEEGTTVSGTVDGTEYSEPIDTETLDVGPHTLVAVIHKQYCNDVTTTRKIMVAKSLEEPVYTFNPNLNGKTVGDFEYLEVSSSTAKASYTVKPSTADGNAKVSSNAGSIPFNATAQKTGQLGPGDYTFTVTVSKDYMISRTFTKYIKVDSKLTPPEIAFTSPAPNGKRDELYYEYIEVDNSSSKASYTVTNKDSRDGTTVSTVVTAMPNNTQVSTNNSGNLDAGIPGSPKKYMIVATVTKDGYEEQRSTKFVAVVAKLKTPQITLGSDFNGKGQDSDGYYYIEVSNATDTVSYLSSTEDNDGTNNPVNVTTKINGVAKGNIGSLGIGDYEIEVTASKAFQNEATFTTKVKVVQELQEPTYSISPNFTSKTLGGFECVEVSSSSGKATLTITAASGCTLSGTNNSTSFSSSTNTQTFTLGTGEYTITGSVNKTNYNSKTFTKKIKVVESLKEPTYTISPDFTGKSLSGYECVEVSSSTGTADLTITVAPGCTIAGTETLNSESAASFGSSPNNYVTLTLGLGNYIITGTVNKTGYNSKSFTKKIKVMESLKEPTIKLTYDGSTVTSAGTPEASSYMLYDAYNIDLKSNGSGALSYEVIPNSADTDATVKVEECYGSTSEINSSGSLALGPHKIKCSVSKDGYVTREFDAKWIYVQGILAPAKIQYSAIKSGGNPVWTEMANNSSTQNLQFSYISYDTMPVKVSPGNEGNEIAVSLERGNSCIASCGKTTSDFENDSSIGHGTSVYTITVYQSRQYCISSETATRKFKAKIKPITLTYQADKFGDDLQVEVRGFGGDSGGMNIKGEIHIVGPAENASKCIWHFEGANKGVTRNQWSTINDTDDAYRLWSGTFTSTSQTIYVHFYDFKRDVSGGSDIQFSNNKKHDFPAISLSDIKKGKGENSTAGTSWTYVCDIANRAGDCARPKIRFTASD